MSTETYGVIQVRGGKFHRPEQTTHDRMKWFSPMLTACHVTVSPVNVFDGMDGALNYTGGRGQFLCRKCFRDARMIEAKCRLAYLRQEIKAERISYGEIAELQDLKEYINPGDVLLLQWAGVPEFKEE